MNIGNKYKIESDSMNITLFEKKRAQAKPDKPSHDYWVTIGYFATPQNALKFLVDLGVKETGMKDLAALVKKQEELYDLINSLKLP